MASQDSSGTGTFRLDSNPILYSWLDNLCLLAATQFRDQDLALQPFYNHYPQLARDDQHSNDYECYGTTRLLGSELANKIIIFYYTRLVGPDPSKLRLTCMVDYESNVLQPLNRAPNEPLSLWLIGDLMTMKINPVTGEIYPYRGGARWTLGRSTLNLILSNNIDYLLPVEQIGQIEPEKLRSKPPPGL